MVVMILVVIILRMVELTLKLMMQPICAHW